MPNEDLCQLQTVRIVLKDGRVGLFTGVAILDPSIEEDAEIDEVFMSVPVDVPADLDTDFLQWIQSESDATVFH